MKHARQVSSDMIKAYDASYQNDKLRKVMTNALAKNSVSTIAYVHSTEKDTQFKFSVDIPTMTATSQKASGRCWLFAGLNVLREIIAKKYNIEEFELSQNYTAFWDKFEKINYFLESVIDLADKPVDDRTLTWVLETGIQDGGQWDMLVSIIEKYGLVPKDVMPETHQSSNTGDMNKLLNKKLRKSASELRKMYQDGSNTEEIQTAKNNMLSDMYGYLCMCFGTPPEKFDFEYVDKDNKYHVERNITPAEFYRQYTGGVLTQYVSIINAPTQDKPFDRAYTVSYLGNVVGGRGILYLNLEIEKFKSLVLKQLQDGEIVWFGSDCSKDGDRDSGVWNDAAYDYEAAFSMSLDMTKEEMLDYRQSAMCHAMVITGVNIDENGKPNRWKIENSWGDEKGCKGYYLMTDTWFDKYVYQAVVNKKYLTTSQLSALDEEPTKLNPWDPMGSLAD